MSLSFTIAKRELRGGLRGFRVFLSCLALGVAAIAAVGTLRTGIQQGLTDQGAVILGGDAEMRFTYRAADAGERAYMTGIATKVSEVYDFRSMVLMDDDQALTQIKAVDDVGNSKSCCGVGGDGGVGPPGIYQATALAPVDVREEE